MPLPCCISYFLLAQQRVKLTVATFSGFVLMLCLTEESLGLKRNRESGCSCDLPHPEFFSGEEIKPLSHAGVAVGACPWPQLWREQRASELSPLDKIKHW